MISDIVNEIIMIDSEIKNADKVKPFELNNISIYEVVRVMKGQPLFLEDHLQRLENSFEILGFGMRVGIKKISLDFGKFVEYAKIENGNVKIMCDGLGGERMRTMVYESVSKYPERILYKIGVQTITAEKTRRLPQAKKTEYSLRKDIDRLKAERGIYEVLLVDGEGFITEGSRSNVFFHQGGVVHTPPIEQVLPGITRMKVMEFCAKKGIEVKIHPIRKSDIMDFDGAFLTGTSINILPIKSIDGISYSENGFDRNLSRLFDKSLLEMDS